MDFLAMPWREMNVTCQYIRDSTTDLPTRRHHAVAGWFTHPHKIPATSNSKYWYSFGSRPSSKLPAGEQKYNRLCGGAENPPRSYLCSICGRYLRWHPEFPDKDTIQKLVNRQKLRESAGDDATCRMCNRMESRSKRIKCIGWNGNVHVNLCRFCLHKNFTRAFLCGPCHLFFDKIPRVRTQVENEKFLTFVTLETTQKAGSENHCDHCQAVEAPDCKHQHLFQPKSDRVLCMPCYSCFERMVMLISTSGVYILHAGEYYGAQGQIGPRNHRSLQNGFGPRRATWC